MTTFAPSLPARCSRAQLQATLRAQGVKLEGPAHLALLLNPWLHELLVGRKTVESRFSTRQIAPYQRVRPGDTVIVKESGGPVRAVFTAGVVRFASSDASLRPKLPLTPDVEIIPWRSLRSFSAALCVDERFWEDKSQACYATLIEVTQLQRLPSPITLTDKGGRQGWVVL